MFRPGTKYAAICQDVMVFNKTNIAPHVLILFLPLQFPNRVIPNPLLNRFSRTDCGGIFLPRKAAIFFITFFTAGFTAFNKRSARGFASSAEEVATTAIDAVVVTIPADGIF